MSESSATEGIPRVRINEPEDEEIRLLRGMQNLLLKHPVAAQELYTALLAEGRRFAETDPGRDWEARLERSSLIHRARLTWELTTLWLLEEEPPDQLPSSYLDALLMLSSNPDLEPLLDRLFKETLDVSTE